MFIQNELQSFLLKQKANRMTDKELSNLINKLDITVKFEDNLIMFVYKDSANFNNDIVNNDAYALGNYGLPHIKYAKLISARWSQLLDRKDEYKF